MRFNGKIDKWIKGYFFIAELFFAYLILLFGFEQFYALLVIPIGIGALIIDIWVRTYYELKEEYLLIRSSIFFIKIKYEDIETIKLKKGLIHGFALSSTQVAIKIRNKGKFLGTTVIAPLDRELFIKELKKYCNITEREV